MLALHPKLQPLNLQTWEWDLDRISGLFDLRPAQEEADRLVGPLGLLKEA